jgi:hypothetical protein
MGWGGGWTGLRYACNTSLTFLHNNYIHQYINTCHATVTLESVLNVCYPAKADIRVLTKQ